MVTKWLYGWFLTIKYLDTFELAIFIVFLLSLCRKKYLIVWISSKVYNAYNGHSRVITLK